MLTKLKHILTVKIQSKHTHVPCKITTTTRKNIKKTLTFHRRNIAIKTKHTDYNILLLFKI